MNQPDQTPIPDPNDGGNKAPFSSRAPTTANSVTISQGGTQSVTAGDVTIRQGGAVSVKADTLDMTMGGIVGAQTQTASLTASEAVGILAGGNVSMDQSAAGILVTAGDVKMDQCGAGAIIAREVKADKSATVFLVAGKVSGNVKTQFGTRDSLIFGAVVGAIVGLTMLGMAMGRQIKERAE